jgi:hypothetical protein
VRVWGVDRFPSSEKGGFSPVTAAPYCAPADGLQTLFSIEQKQCDRSMKR